MTMRLDGPSPEMQISRDLVKRGLVVAPLLLAVCALLWGWNGAMSCAYGLALVLANWVAAAALITFTARISLGLMMAAVLFGYLIRLGVIFIAIYLVRDAGWISLPALGCTIIVTQLGLLFWELRYVSATLAFPGLKPTTPASSHH
jgi:hypothetical protein